jgi:hypothetical protein
MYTNWYDKAEKQLEDDYAAGILSAEEYNEQMRDLQREYRDAADDAAQNAYDREMENW